MRRISLALFIVFLTAASYGQVPAIQRAGFNLPAGQVPAPNTPGGVAVIFDSLFVGDGAQGLRRFAHQDPYYVFDSFDSFGGGTLCAPVCKVGEVVDGGTDAFANETLFIPSYDHGGGGSFPITIPGVWKVSIAAQQGGAGSAPGPVNATLLAQNLGLAGDLPTALALGPDGNLYVGFLKNGNVKRIVNPYGTTQIVQSVGGTPNGRTGRGLTFVGPDLYIADQDSLSVIRNAVATTCQGGCNAVPLPDGFAGQQHVGITSDGLGHLYLGINGSGVWRYTIATGAMTLVSTGGSDPNTGVLLTYAFVGGNTNLIQIDAAGNLWIGDDTSDGTFNFSGRIWEIPAAALATIP